MKHEQQRKYQPRNQDLQALTIRLPVSMHNKLLRACLTSANKQTLSSYVTRVVTESLT